jgi:hypothetical protein
VYNRPMEKKPGAGDRAPDCFKCVYFKITWEPAFPRSCAVFGIKCRSLPSAEVFLSTGAHCPAFYPREAK